MGNVLLAAVTFSDVDHADGGLAYPLHFPDLAITGVGSQDHLAKLAVERSFDKESFPFVAGRMIRRHV